jgi:iron complex transport system substrate-binding protein
VDMKKQGNSKFWNRLAAFGLALVLVLGVVGCGNKNTNTESSASPVKSEAPVASPQEPTKAEVKKTTYPLTIKDASGKEMTFDKAPERIVSLAPSTTEILFSLGLGDKVVGVDSNSDFPAEAKAKPKIGDLGGNAEALVGANGDVVISPLTLYGKTIEELRALNLKLFTTEPKTVDEVIDSILLIGQITDTQEQADKVAAEMRADKQKVVDAVKSVSADKKQNVYIEYFPPLWTAGTGTFMSELVTLSGANNVGDAVKGWTQISEEAVIKANPDIIVYAQGAADDKGTPIEKIIGDRKGWDKLNALKKGRLLGIDQNLISRPGPRITKGLIEMARLIYPDQVK